jgi:hypothetical protein
MSKVSDEQYIKDLEHDVDTLATMVLDLRKEKTKVKQEILKRIQNVLNQGVDTESQDLDLLRHDLENEVINETNNS